MKCEACGEDGAAMGTRNLCHGCFVLCCAAGNAACADAMDKWDREHRKPKEEVIEVEVPSSWFVKFHDRPESDSWRSGIPLNMIWYFDQPIDPPGRLVLKARKE